MTFEEWRAAEMAKAAEAERKARQGLEACRRGPQCCSGWNQRVKQAQKRKVVLQHPEMAERAYMDSSGMGERKIIGQERGVMPRAGKVSSPLPRAGKVSSPLDRFSMERGWGGDGDDERGLFEDPPITYIPKG